MQRVGLSVGALLYGIALGHGHTPYFVALMLAAIWRSE